ncbi:MAG: flagellar biosynthetic protein FliR [Novosphingobium sp.]|nr:flagellar biosynthetic protein FliR [Novosphingobium sp.]
MGPDPTFGFGPLEAEFWRLVFVMTRIGAAMVAAPLFGAGSVPAQVRVIASGALAVLVCGWLPAVQPPPNLLSINGMLAVAGEVLVGLSLGFILQLAFAAPVMAAEVIGGSMGMSMATAVDPNSGTQSPALGQYFTVVMTLIFLATGAHLHWFGLIIESYRTFPPGHTWLGPDRIEAVSAFAAMMFTAAVSIAFPVSLVLLLAQVVTGVLSRSAPSLNLFALGLPAGVLAGLAALILSGPALTDMLTQLSMQAITQAGEIIAR